MLRASITGSLALLLVLSIVVGPVAAIDASEDASAESARSATSAPTDGRLHALAQEGVNNSTTQHENPEEVRADGDIEGLESYLVQRMSRSLSQSTVEISQGEYERGRAVLGDDYSDTLGKYIDVAGETGNTERAESFEQAAENQRSFAETLQEYEETRAEYEAARENGNEERARKRARELERLTRTLTRDGENITAAYREIENGTGVTMDEETRLVDETVHNTSETTAKITTETFEPTTLSVTRLSDAGPISFTGPVRFAGHLTTANGSAVANETLRVGVADRSYTVQTDEDGRFTLTYAPVRLPIDSREVTVQFRPEATTAYLGANATLPVAIEQTTATVSVNGPATAAFGDTVSVEGQLVANGTAVPSAPVRLTLGGHDLGTTTTNANGTYTLTTPLPADIPTGSQPLTADVPLSERAITANASESTVAVTASETTLSLNATAVDPHMIRFTARLTDLDGTPVSRQSIVVQFDGRPVTTLTTERDGTVRGQVSVPASLNSTGNVTVVATFAGGGTNLASSSARTTVSHPSWTDAGSSGSLFHLDGWLQWGAGLAALVVLVGAGYTVRRRLRDTTQSKGPGHPADDGADTTQSPPSDRILTLATDTLAQGDTGAAVELAFTAIRQRLEEQFDIEPGLTHREFVTACTTAGVTTMDSLTEAARLYEQSAFGAGTVSTSTAEMALSLARTIVDGGTAAEQPVDGTGNADAGARPSGDD